MQNDKSYWYKEIKITKAQISECEEYSDGFDNEDEYEDHVANLHDYLTWCEDNIKRIEKGL